MKNKTLQSIIQVVFLLLFIFLFTRGRIQIWMGVFLLGLIASLLFSRLYCGWICPINTVMKGVTWAKKKLKIKSFKIPKMLTKGWVGGLVLVLFLATFVFVMVTGRPLPVLPALFGLGILVTLFFPEELWHRYLCPYGRILSFPASKAKRSIYIDTGLCNNCGACMRVCPGKAIEKDEDSHHIIKKDCLVCMDCTRICPKNAISYKHTTGLETPAAKV